MTLSGRNTFATAIVVATMLSGCSNKATVLGPDKQSALSRIIESGKEQYKSAGANEIKKSEARAERANEIKELVEASSKVSFVKWSCRVDTISTKSSGDISLVNLDCGGFKIKLNETVSKKSELYSSIANQSIGPKDRVIVSGELDVDKNRDWLTEGSVTEFGSMLFPDLMAKKLVAIEKNA